jgi:hypothetical protein
MALAFRNVDADPADPVRTWPVEAVRAALERGGLGDWRRLASEIRADPWGLLARRVAETTTVDPPYGSGPLLAAVLQRARADAEAAERAEVAAAIADLLDESGLSRAEFAAAIGTSVSRLSTYLSGWVTPSAALLVRMRRVVAQVRND